MGCTDGGYAYPGEPNRGFKSIFGINWDTKNQRYDVECVLVTTSPVRAFNSFVDLMQELLESCCSFIRLSWNDRLL